MMTATWIAAVMNASPVTAHSVLIADDHPTNFRSTLAVQVAHANKMSTNKTSMFCLAAMGKVATDMDAKVGGDQSSFFLLEATRHATNLDSCHDTRTGIAASMATVRSQSALKAANLTDNTNEPTIRMS